MHAWVCQGVLSPSIWSSPFSSLAIPPSALATCWYGPKTRRWREGGRREEGDGGGEKVCPSILLWLRPPFTVLYDWPKPKKRTSKEMWTRNPDLGECLDAKKWAGEFAKKGESKGRFLFPSTGGRGEKFCFFVSVSAIYPPTSLLERGKGGKVASVPPSPLRLRCTVVCAIAFDGPADREEDVWRKGFDKHLQQ